MKNVKLIMAFLCVAMSFGMMGIISCSKAKEKNDNFLNVSIGTSDTQTEKKETRIHVIDDGGWTWYQIVEVDGHQYLSNNTKGGMVHLESCPCKTKN